MKFTKLLLAALLVAGIAWGQLSEAPEYRVSGVRWEALPPQPVPASRIQTAYTGAAGASTYYYWVCARYQIGRMVATYPVVVTGAAAIGALNTVTLRWPAAPGALTYDILRTITPAFPGACPAAPNGCSVGNTAALTITDNVAAAALGAYAVGAISAAQAYAQINNRDWTAPALEFKGSAAPRGWTAFDTEVTVSGTNNTYLDWSTRTAAAVYGVTSRISSDLTGGTTSVYGASFYSRALVGGAGGGVYIGARGTATQYDAKFIGTDILTGVYGEALPSVGLVYGSYGVFGIFRSSGTAAAGLNLMAAGVKGDWDDTLGLEAATNYTAGVMGYISDRNVAGPDGAVVAVLAGGGVRVAGNSPVAAFRVVDLNAGAGIGFDYGFDAYWTDGAGLATAFNIADIRGANASLLHNEAALRWRSDSEVRVAGLADVYLDWSARTDAAVYGVRSRIASDLTGGTFTVHGGHFMARPLVGGAGGGVYIGARGSAIQDDAKFIGTDILIGVSGEATPSVGLLFGSYGVFGIFQPTGTATAGLNMMAAGVKGDFDDAVGLTTPLETTAGVIGYISDQHTPGPTGAVIAVLAGGGLRQAADSPTSAFRVVDWNADVGVGFDYGFDAYWTDGVAAVTAFNIADIRGQLGSTLDNAQAGIWRAAPAIALGNAGFQPTAMTAAVVAAWAAPDGTIGFCSDCTAPAAGAGPLAWAGCAVAGTGAHVYRQNAVWVCN